MRIFSLFGALFIVFGAMVATYTYRDLFPFYLPHTEAEAFGALWKQDIETMLINNQLPQAWSSIKEVEYLKPGNQKAQGWLAKEKPLIPIRPDGEYKLQVFLDAWEASDTKTRGAMVQYTIVHLKTNNTIWELGRTFDLTAQQSQ